jgi:hypothetical protein
MKNLLITFYLIFTAFLSTVAQDIITQKSGAEINGRIVKLNSENITFIQKGSADTSIMPRAEISKLRYQNGTLVYISNDMNQANKFEVSNDSMYNAGKADADLYYKGYKAATAGTIVSALMFPFNLIPAVACSATPPSMNNLGYRDPKLMENPGYFYGYTKQAHKIKKKKVWGGYAIGSGAIILISILLTSVATTTY